MDDALAGAPVGHHERPHPLALVQAGGDLGGVGVAEHPRLGHLAGEVGDPAAHEVGGGGVGPRRCGRGGTAGRGPVGGGVGGEVGQGERGEHRAGADDGGEGAAGTGHGPTTRATDARLRTTPPPGTRRGRLVLVGRGGVEPPTFHFSGGRSYQLSYLPERREDYRSAGRPTKPSPLHSLPSRPPSSSGPGPRPFTAVARVRIPLGVPGPVGGGCHRLAGGPLRDPALSRR